MPDYSLPDETPTAPVETAGLPDARPHKPEETVVWADSFVKRFLAQHPRLGNLVAVGGIAAPVVAHIAQDVSHVEAFKLTLYEQFGATAFYVFHLAFVGLLVLLLLVGFGALTLLLDRRLRARRVSVGRRTWTASMVGVVGLAAAGASIWAWAPALPHTQATLTRISDRWRADLFSTQGRDGGFRYDRSDLEAETQGVATAQALTAILSRTKPLGGNEVAATRAAFEFLHRIELDEKDEGWGYFGYVPWGVTEINAWIALALVRSMKPPFASVLWGLRLPEAQQRLAHCSDLILARLTASGGWSPVNDTREPRFVRTYSTAMAVWALLEIQRLQPADSRSNAVQSAIQGGITWLLANADMDAGGWRPSPFQKHKLEGYPGLSAQVVYVLLQAAPEFKPILVDGGFQEVLVTFDGWLAGEAIPPRGMRFSAQPLANNDRMHDADRYLHRSPRMLEGTTYLWYAWALMACKERERSEDQFPDVSTFPGCSRLAVRINEDVRFVTNETSSYVISENLLALDALAGLSAVH